MSFSPKHISHSQLTMYEDCPRKYFYNYVMGIKGETPDAWTFGSAFHKGLEFHYKGKNFIDGLKAHLLKAMRENQISKDKGKEMYRMGMGMFSDFKVYGRKFEAHQVEYEIFTPLKNPVTGETLPIPMKGVVDLITVENDWVDHKTTSGDMDIEKYTRQLQTYSLMIRSKTGQKPRKMVIQSFLKRINTGKTDYFEIEPDEINEAILFERIKYTLGQILENRWEAKPSYSGCRMCPFRKICPQSAVRK